MGYHKIIKPRFEDTQAYGLIPGHSRNNGLKGYWLLNEAAGNKIIDISGNQNHADASGGVAWDGADLKCDGIDGVVKTGPLDHIGGFSLLFWFKSPTAAVASSIEQPLCWSSPSDRGLAFSFNHSSGAYTQAWAIYDGGWDPLKFTTSLLADIWYLIAITYDGTTARAYLNGNLEVSLTKGTPVDSGTEIIAFGGGAGGTKSYSEGWVNEAQLYDRPLSPNEMSDQYDRRRTNIWVPRTWGFVDLGVNTYSYTMSGGLIAGGNTTYTLGKAYSSSGGLVAGGLTAYTWTPVAQSYTYIMTGGLVAGGSTVYLRGKVYSLSGGLIAGGVTAYTWTGTQSYNHTMTAGGIFGGLTNYNRGVLIAPFAGLIAGGMTNYTWSNTQSYVHIMTGGLISGGDTVYFRGRNYVSSGGLVAGGDTLYAWTGLQSYTYIMAGGVVAGGITNHTWTGLQSYTYIMSGGLIGGGITSHTWVGPSTGSTNWIKQSPVESSWSMQKDVNTTWVTDG